MNSDMVDPTDYGNVMTEDIALAYMNQHYALVHGPIYPIYRSGIFKKPKPVKRKIIIVREVQLDGKIEIFLHFQSSVKLYEGNKYVLLPDKNGKMKKNPIFKWWINHSLCRTYENFDYQRGIYDQADYNPQVKQYDPW